MMATTAPGLRRPLRGPWLAAVAVADDPAAGRVSAAAALTTVLLSVGLGLACGASTTTCLLWVLLAPLLEEAVFRVGLQDALLRHGLPPWLANGCTALCFTAAHVLLRGAGWASWAVLLPALLLGLVYGRTRQLRGCVALHALMNAGWIAAQQLVPV